MKVHPSLLQLVIMCSFAEKITVSKNYKEDPDYTPLVSDCAFPLMSLGSHKFILIMN